MHSDARPGGVAEEAVGQLVRERADGGGEGVSDGLQGALHGCGNYQSGGTISSSAWLQQQTVAVGRYLPAVPALAAAARGGCCRRRAARMALLILSILLL